MPIPTWVPGQVLAASDVNNWFIPLAAYKAGDTSRTTNTTLTPDPDLVVPVSASAVYTFHAFFDYEGANAAGFLKWQWTVPAAATLRYAATFVGTGGGININLYQGTDVVAGYTLGAGNTMAMVHQGTLITAGSAGNITLTWAQNASNGTSTILHAQSSLVMQRIA